MKNIFCPNGIYSSEILINLYMKEFSDNNIKPDSYLDLKESIINHLKRKSTSELEEIRLETLVGLKHLEQNDFGNFINIRFAYWALMLAIFFFIIDWNTLKSYINISNKQISGILCTTLTFLLVTFSRTIHIQHDQTEYLDFKLLCIEEIINKNNIKM